MFRSILVVIFATCACSLAYSEDENSPYASHDGITDGTSAAAAGTILYNSLNPSNPLPVHPSDSSVIHDNARNLGAGMKIKDAYKKSVQTNSGVGAQ